MITNRPTEAEVRAALAQYTWQGATIPKYMHDGIVRYLCEGIEPGSFLSAVLCNDLYSAVRQADDHNVHLLPVYVGFFYNHAPSTSWRSRQNFEQWLRKLDICDECGGSDDVGHMPRCGKQGAQHAAR